MSETGPVSGPPSLARNVLYAACQANALFSERYDLGTWKDLGHGSFAGVVRIHCRDRGEDVAVKIFLELSEEARARIRAEVANAQRIHSPLLVHLYAPFSFEDLAWIEMEYVQGRNLQQELDRRDRDGFPVKDALDLGIAIAEALCAAHEAGVLHRDLKPANLLLPDGGRPLVKLGDFGMSKFHQAAKLTATGEFRGTPEYAAPEAWESKPVGPSADIYSLSLVLFRLFAKGGYAYELPPNANTGQVYLAHRKQKPRRASDVNRAVPKAIDALLARGLSKNPSQRPSLDEVVATLKSQQRAIAEAGGQPRASQRRLSRLAIAVSMVLVATALLLFYRARFDNGIDPTGDRTPLPSATTALPVSTPPVDRIFTPSQKPQAPSPASIPPTTAPKRVDPSFGAALDGQAVAITNTSKYTVHDVEVVLLDATQARHTIGPISVLGAGELILLPLEEFTPAFSEGVHPRRAEVEAGTPTGNRVATTILFKK